MFPLRMLGLIRQEANPVWRVLDVGCRDGRSSEWFISHRCDVTGIDIEDHAADAAAKGFTFVQCALEDYQPDHAFDVVVAMHVLPFVKGTWDARIDHVERLVVPGGLLLCTVFAPDDGFAGRPDIATIRDEEFRDLLVRRGWRVRYEGHERFDGPTYQGAIKPWSVIGVLAERAR